MPDIEEVARIAVDCGYRIHDKLGPGLLESVYEAVLELELRRAGLGVQRQVQLPVIYDDIVLNEGFRIDLLVERSLVIEVKSIESWRPSMGSSCSPT